MNFTETSPSPAAMICDDLSDCTKTKPQLDPADPQEAKCYCVKLLCSARVLLKADSAPCTLSIRRDLISLQGPMRNEQYNVHSGHNP